MYFLAFEGIDSSGKSTLLDSFKNYLLQTKKQFITTREPGGTPLAEKLRLLLLEHSDEAPVSLAELFLYMAVRAQHVEKTILPSLKKNQWVLCDRFSASSLAFQSGGRGLDEVIVEELNTYATNKLQPDLCILVDISVEESQKRRQGQQQDRFEVERTDFHQRVRDSYLKQAKQNPSHWLVLNGLDTKNILLEKLISCLKEKKWL